VGVLETAVVEDDVDVMFADLAELPDVDRDGVELIEKSEEAYREEGRSGREPLRYGFVGRLGVAGMVGVDGCVGMFSFASS
jgi:hypothetical protein